MAARYPRQKPHSHREKQFIEWCAQRITQWPEGMKAAVVFSCSRFKSFHFRERYDGLSYAWDVCSRKSWLAARAKVLQAKPAIQSGVTSQKISVKKSFTSLLLCAQYVFCRLITQGRTQ